MWRPVVIEPVETALKLQSCDRADGKPEVVDPLSFPRLQGLPERHQPGEHFHPRYGPVHAAAVRVDKKQASAPLEDTGAAIGVGAQRGDRRAEGSPLRFEEDAVSVLVKQVCLELHAHRTADVRTGVLDEHGSSTASRIASK